MIAGLLVLSLLVVREIVRGDDLNGARTRVVSRMLLPASVGLAALMVVRLAGLVVGHA